MAYPRFLESRFFAHLTRSWYLACGLWTARRCDGFIDRLYELNSDRGASVTVERERLDILSEIVSYRTTLAGCLQRFRIGGFGPT